MQNMLKILGISDKILWLSWYLFFILYNVPALSVVAVLSRHFAFTVSDIWFIVALLSLALLASIAFALVVTAVFTDGNLAGEYKICTRRFPLHSEFLNGSDLHIFHNVFPYSPASWSPLAHSVFCLRCAGFPVLSNGGLRLVYPYLGPHCLSTVRQCSMGPSFAVVHHGCLPCSGTWRGKHQAQ